MQENPFRTGLELPREPRALTLVIFGASGDLTRRKLIPALFSLFLKDGIPGVRIVGFARRNWDASRFRAAAREWLDDDGAPAADAELKDAFTAGLDFISAPFESPEGYARIAEAHALPADRIFYLATPPDAYPLIVERIREQGLADQSRGFARIVVEKPLGRDRESARNLNALISRAFPEEQIYRIDHYLGKETVQNIMVTRFGNEIFEPVWNNRYVDHVQITMAEALGVEGRGGYYEGAGALRDMMQNHMLQLLALVAMEPPIDLDPDSIRTEKVKVLRSLAPISAAEVAAHTVRGQYDGGVVDGAAVPGYREEPGVAPGSETETYVALRARLDSWRWAGVPFLLRTGKRLARRTTEIAIHFKRPPILLFGGMPSAPRNTLTFRIQPEEGITVGFNTKVPGPTTTMRPVNMDFSYGSAFGGELPEAYERLLLDAMLGDSTLYMRKDEVDAAWAYVTEILRGWEAAGLPSLERYRAGGAGPAAADGLLGSPARRWGRI